MYKSADLARFVRESLKPALPSSYLSHKPRFLLRAHGNAVQGIVIGVGRGGWVRVHPSLYVTGADRADEGIHQTVSLSTRYPRRWNFSPDTPLDDALTKEILERLENDSPISFKAPLDDAALDRGLRWFGRKARHWSADLFLAFYGMTRGTAMARRDLERARLRFHRYSRLSRGKPPRDWEKQLHERFDELESRLDQPDCVALCRQDAEAHAEVLALPPLVWPPEWPQSVPPRQKTASWSDRLGRLFRR